MHFKLIFMVLLQKTASVFSLRSGGKMEGASGDLRVSMKAVAGSEPAWTRDYANSSDSVVITAAICKREQEYF